MTLILAKKKQIIYRRLLNFQVLKGLSYLRDSHQIMHRGLIKFFQIRFLYEN